MNLSGVIVVVIVGLWGSLLIPALVRKHDSITEVRSVDRFSYALRILSRRTPYIPGRREVLVPRKSAAARRPVVSPAPGFVADLPGARQQPNERAAAARRRAVAAKRRRAIVALVLALALCVGLALRSGGRWWLTVAISAVLLVMYVTNLRNEAQQQAQIARRRAQARRRAGRQAAPVRAAAPVRRAEPVPADVPVAAAAQPADSWAPVPVTLPTYVTKPVAPQPTMAPPTGAWYDGVAAEQRAARFAAGGDVYDQMSDDEVSGGDYLGLSRDDDALYGVDGLDAIIERRRAVND